MAIAKKKTPRRINLPTAKKPAWQAAFPTKKAYDESLASVVARIKSGEVQPRVPDEE